jgi:tetratricopeptide (TPR) repeat protein
MAIERNGAVASRLVTVILPWVVGGVGLLIYGLTLNRWISLFDLGIVTRISGWSWRPELSQPLTLILLYPFRWLPEPAIPLALNLFTAICAGLVLVLLTRSVALLPHDLAPNDPLRPAQPASILSTPMAWMPPVLAAMVCGLQLSFWEHATSASGEIIDLLVFAYVLHCLLEFGVSRDQAWFSRCALVFGAGVANNWAMAGYLPLFLIAVLRSNGLVQSLDRRFILRMSLWGSAGLSLCLLLPAVQGLLAHGELGFWTTLKIHLNSQKDALVALQTPAFMLLTLASLVSFLILSIRWKLHTVQLSDDTRLGVFLTKATGHLMHGLFLVVSLWIALDPAFSPRLLGLRAPMLMFYYVSALTLGYCTGYFLLIASGNVAGRRFARAPVCTVGALMAAVPLALLARNLDSILATNGPALREFARQLYADLPPGKCVVLSEDTRQLTLLRAELGNHRPDKDPILLDTLSLPCAQYHRVMANQFKSRWPAVPPTNALGVLGPFQMQDLIRRFAAQEPVVYLHPSSGLLREPFADEPHGFIHHLALCPPGDVLNQKLAEDVVATNDLIWQQRWSNSLENLTRLTKSRSESRPEWIKSLRAVLRFVTEQNPTASVLGAAYSKSLNDWGVELQRLGRWTDAAVWFQRALELNPGNLASRINLLYNQHHRQGDRARLDPKAVETQFHDLFVKYGNWPEVLTVGGPVDEPTFLLRTGRVMYRGGNDRQAARAFARCAELEPDWPAPQLWLAGSYLRLGEFDRALELSDRIQAFSDRMEGSALVDLLDCSVTALRRLGRTNEATTCIESYIGKYWKQDEVVSGAADLYAETGQWMEAMTLLDELLKRDPNQTGLLAKKGFALLQLSQYDAAVATLTRVLAVTPADEEVRLHRAAASLAAGQLDAARSDYEQLLQTSTHSQPAVFGLGGIAWRQHDTNAAIQYYQQYLSNGIPESPQHRLASERLKQLKSGGFR